MFSPTPPLATPKSPGSTTLNHWQVSQFMDRFVTTGAGSFEEALDHLSAITGISVQSLLWLDSGKAQTVTTTHKL